MSVIIDSHVHCYPPEVVADPGGWAAARGESHWAELHVPAPGRSSIAGWTDADGLLADMDKAGVERAVLLAWYWENQETCDLQNRWHIDWVREHPDRFIGFAAVQPMAEERAFEAVRRAIGQGLSGIGEMLPAAQGFSHTNSTWMRILDWAQEENLPITIHVSEPVGHDYAGRVETPLEEYQWLVRQFPNLKMILAHWGGGLPFYELNATCRSDFQNVFYDTAASPLLYDKKVFRVVAELAGADKILFGSDYPLRLFPKLDKKPGFERFLEQIDNAGLTDIQKEKILGGNARKLFGLG